MPRRSWVVFGLLFGLTLAIGLPAEADTILDAARMKAGLRTTTIEDGGFVERVVTMANNGQLPVALVDSTFLWARNKNRHRFQYFRRALTLRAAKIGIRL